MKRNLVREEVLSLNYEIREIIIEAKKIELMGQKIFWENIGDPVLKGEKIPSWIKKIVILAIKENINWAYSPTLGIEESRKFILNQISNRNKNKINVDGIIFFNGVSDAISKIYTSLNKKTKIIVPDPVYPTHSGEEFMHDGDELVKYKLDPNINWDIDFNDLETKIKNNNNIGGILIINPNNPTGRVYSGEILKKIVKLAKENNLFIISDEIYGNIVFNGAKYISLSEVIGNVPAIILKGISKELPWPGARCGWMEVYNKNKDKDFQKYINSIIKIKTLEVSSTTLPQAVLPLVFGRKEYFEYLQKRKNILEKKANYIYDNLKDLDGVIVNRIEGAFYFTVVFKDDILNNKQKLPIKNKKINDFIGRKIKSFKFDKRFTYYLLGSTGICVIPLTSFCSDVNGFRVTLLENDLREFKNIVKKLKYAIHDYIESNKI